MGGDHMKNKSVARGGNGKGNDKRNGHRNPGNGKSNGDDDGNVAVAAPEMEMAESDGKHALKDQPPILSLLTDRGQARGKQLNKTQLLEALLAFKKGNFSMRLPVDREGVDGKHADAFDD